MKKYRLKWKGDIVGPFSKEQLTEMLERGKIGLMHEVEVGDEDWVFIRDFFKPPSSPVLPENTFFNAEPPMENFSNIGDSDAGEFAEANKQERQAKLLKVAEDSESTAVPEVSEAVSYLVYILCGASFLSPFIYFAALAFAGILYAKGNVLNAKITAVLSSIIALFGFLFFKLIYPAISL